MLKVLVRNTVSNGVATVIRAAVNFLLTPFLVLHLGKEVYGLWVLILSFSVSGTMSLLSLGMQAALVKHVAEFHALKKWREMNEVISSTLYLYTSMGVVGAIGLVAVSHFWFTKWFVISPEHASVAVIILDIMAVQVLFEMPGLCFDGILGGVQRYDILAAMEFLKAAVLAGAFAIAILRGGTVITLSILALAVTVIYSSVLLFFARQQVSEWRLVRSVQREQMKSVIGMTKDLLIVRINGIVYNNMDKMIIATVLATALVTDYDISNRIHNLVLMVMGLAGTVVIPAASAAHAKSEHERIRKLFLRGTKYALALTLPVIGALFVLAPAFIQYWVSSSYVHSAYYARLFLCYLSFWGLTAVGWNMLIGVKQTKAIVRIQIVSVSINLTLSCILVRYIGVSGVIFGTIVGNLVAIVPYMRLMIRSFDVTARDILTEIILPTYPQAIVASLLLLLVTRAWPPHSLYSVFGFCAFCGALFLALFWSTGMTRDDRTEILSLIFPARYSKRQA